MAGTDNAALTRVKHLLPCYILSSMQQMTDQEPRIRQWGAAACDFSVRSVNSYGFIERFFSLTGHGKAASLLPGTLDSPQK